MGSIRVTSNDIEVLSERLDRFVSERTGMTRSRVRKLIEGGFVLVNGQTARPGRTLKEGDEVTVNEPEPEPDTLVAEDLPVEILYSDSHLVIVDKPAGMVVYPAAGHPRGTLMNALRGKFRHLAGVGGPFRPGVVHRLDKDTSGVMVVALEDESYYSLVEQFRKRSIERSYQALIYGTMKEDSGEITLGIGRAMGDRKKMSTRTRRTKDAMTSWRVLRRFRGASLIRAQLGTGRTHQIRVHFASIGHPVLGDRTYGRITSIQAGETKVRFPRQMLHAEFLGLTHPASGERMSFRTDPPSDMADAIDRLLSVV